MTYKVSTFVVGDQHWKPTDEQVEAIAAAYTAMYSAPSNLYPPPATEQEHMLAETLDASLNEVRAMSEAEKAAKTASFMERFRERTKGMVANAAFHDFFELANKLNDLASPLGIRQVILNAESGEVSVTYRTRQNQVAAITQGEK